MYSKWLITPSYLKMKKDFLSIWASAHCTARQTHMLTRTPARFCRPAGGWSRSVCDVSTPCGDKRCVDGVFVQANVWVNVLCIWQRQTCTYYSVCLLLLGRQCVAQLCCEYIPMTKTSRMPLFYQRMYTNQLYYLPRGWRFVYLKINFFKLLSTF